MRIDATVTDLRELGHVPYVADQLAEEIRRRGVSSYLLAGRHPFLVWARERNRQEGWTYAVSVVVEGRDETRVARNLPIDLLDLAIALAERRCGIAPEPTDPTSERSDG